MMHGFGQSVGIIADDLTGACDTALQFHLGGASTTVLLDTDNIQSGFNAQVTVVNTDSRHLHAQQAAEQVSKALYFLKNTVKVERYYKKMDSVLRGHIVPECEAAIAALGCKGALIAPAYPVEGRRTVGGYQLVRGYPVSQTEVTRDPLFPVRESHIPTLLAQSYPQNLIGYLPLSTVLDGAGPIRTKLLEELQQGKKLIVADACSPTDLEQISLALVKMPENAPLLPCGSAGLAKALSKRWLAQQPSNPSATHRKITALPLLFAIGSISHITQEQMRTLEAFCNDENETQLFSIRLTPSQILGRDPVDAEISLITQHLTENHHVLITTSDTSERVDNTLLLARELEMSPLEASISASNILGHIVNRVLEQVQACLVMSGGETAHTICKATGLTTLHIVDAIEPSIPLMLDAQARWVVTKSGSFGTPQSFVNILQTLHSQAASAVAN